MQDLGEKTVQMSWKRKMPGDSSRILYCGCGFSGGIGMEGASVEISFLRVSADGRHRRGVFRRGKIKNSCKKPKDMVS